MSYIENLVSNKKNTLKEMPKNLDISYITPRVLAMALPSNSN